MSDTTTTIDYDAIVQALKDRIEHVELKFGRFMGLSSYDPTYLKELRTLGFYAPRQSGRSIWVMNEMTKNPKTIVITVNRDIRNHLVLRQCQGPTPQNPTVIKADLESINKRVMTIQDFRTMMGERGATADTTDLNSFEFPVAFDTIIFDDSHAIFDRLRKGKVYTWLSVFWKEHQIRDPYVILVN